MPRHGESPEPCRSGGWRRDEWRRPRIPRRAHDVTAPEPMRSASTTSRPSRSNGASRSQLTPWSASPTRRPTRPAACARPGAGCPQLGPLVHSHLGMNPASIADQNGHRGHRIATRCPRRAVPCLPEPRDPALKDDMRGTTHLRLSRAPPPRTRNRATRTASRDRTQRPGTATGRRRSPGRRPVERVEDGPLNRPRQGRSRCGAPARGRGSG